MIAFEDLSVGIELPTCARLVTSEDIAAYASRVVSMRDGSIRTDVRQTPRQAAVDLQEAFETLAGAGEGTASP